MEELVVFAGVVVRDYVRAGPECCTVTPPDMCRHQQLPTAELVS